MAGVLVVGVAGRFELECGVFDVEVGCEALLEPVQQLWGVAVLEALVVDDHVRGEHGQPDVTVWTCRS